MDTFRVGVVSDGLLLNAILAQNDFLVLNRLSFRNIIFCDVNTNYHLTGLFYQVLTVFNLLGSTCLSHYPCSSLSEQQLSCSYNVSIILYVFKQFLFGGVSMQFISPLSFLEFLQSLPDSGEGDHSIIGYRSVRHVAVHLQVDHVDALLVRQSHLEYLACVPITAQLLQNCGPIIVFTATKYMSHFCNFLTLIHYLHLLHPPPIMPQTHSRKQQRGALEAITDLLVDWVDSSR